MPEGLSFRSRLLLSFLAVVVLSLVVATLLTQANVGRGLLKEAEHDARGRLELVALAVGQSEKVLSLMSLDDWFKEVGGRLGLRMSLVNDQGRIVADSRLPMAELVAAEPLIGNPAVAEARDAGLGIRLGFDPQSGREVVYAAKPLPAAGSRPAGVLLLTLPIAEVKARMERLLGGFVLGALLALAVGVAIALVLSRQLANQVQDLSLAAEAVGKGDYARRLRLFPGREFSPLVESINQMARNIQAQILTITVQKEQLVAILDNMKEGVMLLGLDGSIKAVNRALTEIFPGMESALGRTPIEALMEPALQSECDAALRSVPDAAAPRFLQIEPRKGLVYDVGIVPLRERDSGLGAVVVFHDISRLKQLERVRRDFVANVSHELRTPLTSIKGYAETLHGDERMDPKAKPFLEIIIKNANHMAKMLGDLLNLSRLEADQQSFKTAAVDAASAAVSAYRECEVLGRPKGVRLDNRLPPRELWVTADYDRLVQVFRNLLENALRYSPEKQVVALFHERRGDELVFGVSDHGPGVPKDEQAKIFERFYRVEKHRGKGAGSSGLGLAIAKHIVERHGGRIWVVSPAAGQDDGATFCFSIPVAQPQAAAAAPEQT